MLQSLFLCSQLEKNRKYFWEHNHSRFIVRIVLAAAVSAARMCNKECRACLFIQRAISAQSYVHTCRIFVYACIHMYSMSDSECVPLLALLWSGTGHVNCTIVWSARAAIRLVTSYLCGWCALDLSELVLIDDRLAVARSAICRCSARSTRYKPPTALFY